MNFIIKQNGLLIDEYDKNGFSLEEVLKDYKKYSDITVYDDDEEGELINNLPEEKCGIQTGNMMFDYYGCWYEYKPNDGSKNCWIIGEYPDYY